MAQQDAGTALDQKRLEEEKRRQEFHRKLGDACRAGFEAGARGIKMCEHYHGSPLRVVWEACREVAEQRKSLMRDKPEGRLEEIEQVLLDLAGQVGGLKGALSAAQEETQAQPG